MTSQNTPHPVVEANSSTTCCTSASTATSAMQPATNGQRFRIASMDCSAEESEIRQALEPISGIHSLGFQLGDRTLNIYATDEALSMALSAIRKAGFDPQPVQMGKTTPAHDDEDSEEHAHDQSDGMARLAAALAFAVVAEAIAYFAPDLAIWKGFGMAVAALAIWLAGISTYKKGLAALMRGKLNINALMSVAVTGAFLIGQWPEAAMVMALYAIAELIEAKAVDRARNAIKGLLALAPEEALVLGANGEWVVTPAGAVPLEAIVRIKPGERVALDGVVTKGSSAINQASVTGESIPVDKAPGDAVFAGTINETGELEFRVTAAANNTTLARIIHAVEQAQGTRAPTQRFVDRFAAIYTPAVFATAVAVAVFDAHLDQPDLAGSCVQGIGFAGHCLSVRIGEYPHQSRSSADCLPLHDVGF